MKVVGWVWQGSTAGRFVERVGFEPGLIKRVEVTDGDSGDDGKEELACVG